MPATHWPNLIKLQKNWQNCKKKLAKLQKNGKIAKKWQNCKKLEKLQKNNKIANILQIGKNCKQAQN